MPQSVNLYDEDYFLRGKQSGKSNYENYSWKRDLTVFCASRMALFMGCRIGESILDWGCARGYYVKALRLLGYEAFGYDISEWAIENADEEVRSICSNVLTDQQHHWIFCKDVLEHVEQPYLDGAIEVMLRLAKKGILIIVPLGINGRFLAPQDNEDKTHINCFDLPEWLNLIQGTINKSRLSFVVSGGYKLPGVKEACDSYPGSVAFISIRRL